MVGAGHPRVDISITGYLTNPPNITSESIFSNRVSYTPFVSRDMTVESEVRSLFTDGRRIVTRNGYTVVEVAAKYDGNNGIDGLFFIKKGRRTSYVAIESKYLSANEPYFYFGPGIQHDTGPAEQMSHAWIRIVGHTLCERVGEKHPNFAFYYDIKHNPREVIRAVATGDKDGNFNIVLLDGYQQARRDEDLLRALLC